MEPEPAHGDDRDQGAEESTYERYEVLKYRDGTGTDIASKGGHGRASQPHCPMLHGVGSEVSGVSQNANKGDFACILC